MEKESKITEIYYKPKNAPLVSLVIGGLMFLTRQWELMLLGALFITISAIIVFGLKDTKKATIYSDHIVLYDDAEEIMADVAYETLREWNTGDNGIRLIVNENEAYFTETRETSKANKALRQWAAEKETIAILQNKIRQQKFKNPFKKNKIRK